MDYLSVENFKKFATEKLEEKNSSSHLKTDLAEESFSNILSNTMDEVNKNQIQADFAIKELVTGRTKNIHETMLAIEKADTSLKLLMQFRNKILDAYREIMRMQV